MDINILKTFLEVHRTCHFGKAADNLFVTQATVSARIQQLESELGVKLFTRARNNIQLTPAGRKFLNHAESILNVWHRARFDIRQEEGKTSIAIGAVPSLWDIYLLNWLARIKTCFPDLSIIADAVSTDSLIRQLLDQSIDLGFTYDYPQIAGLAVRESLAFELVMVSSREKLTVTQALTDNYIFVNWGSSFTDEHSRYFPNLPAPDLKLGLGHVAHEYIRKEGGSAYLPEPMVRNDLSNGILYRVEDAPRINRKSFVIYQENTARRELLESLISMNHQTQ